MNRKRHTVEMQVTGWRKQQKPNVWGFSGGPTSFRLGHFIFVVVLCLCFFFAVACLLTLRAAFSGDKDYSVLHFALMPHQTQGISCQSA